MTTSAWPSPFAACGRRLRPRNACRHAFWLPAFGLLVGAVSGEFARPFADAVVPIVVSLVFATVAAVEAKPPSRQDVARTLVILLSGSLICPAVVWFALQAAHAPADICWAVTVAFAGPVSMGAGVLCARLGQPARPAVWASLAGMMLCPLTLPMISAAANCGVDLSPLTLTRNAALLGAAPALAAFAWRRLSPKTSRRAQKDMRGFATIMLSVLAVAAGHKAHSAFDSDAGPAVVTAILTALVLAAAVGWAVGSVLGPILRDRGLGPMTMLCAGMRNASIAWAAVATTGLASPHLEGLFAICVALPSLIPLVAMVVAKPRTASAGKAVRPTAA